MPGAPPCIPLPNSKDPFISSPHSRITASRRSNGLLDGPQVALFQYTYICDKESSSQESKVSNGSRPAFLEVHEWEMFEVLAL